MSAPPPDPPPDAEITLREITRATYRSILRLATTEAQRAFVAPVPESLAEALFHPQVVYRGIYADDTPVGFLLLSRDPEQGEVGLWRFMIDRRYQRRGYGTRAMQRTLDLVRETCGYADRLLLSHAPGDGHPGPFYERLGFTYTGDEVEGELVMSIPLRGPRPDA